MRISPLSYNASTVPPVYKIQIRPDREGNPRQKGGETFSDVLQRIAEKIKKEI